MTTDDALGLSRRAALSHRKQILRNNFSAGFSPAKVYRHQTVRQKRHFYLALKKYRMRPMCRLFAWSVCISSCVFQKYIICALHAEKVLALIDRWCCIYSSSSHFPWRCSSISFRLVVLFSMQIFCQKLFTIFLKCYLNNSRWKENGRKECD